MRFRLPCVRRTVRTEKWALINNDMAIGQAGSNPPSICVSISARFDCFLLVRLPELFGCRQPTAVARLNRRQSHHISIGNLLAKPMYTESQALESVLDYVEQSINYVERSREHPSLQDRARVSSATDVDHEI